MDVVALLFDDIATLHLSTMKTAFRVGEIERCKVGRYDGREFGRCEGVCENGREEEIINGGFEGDNDDFTDGKFVGFTIGVDDGSIDGISFEWLVGLQDVCFDELIVGFNETVTVDVIEGKLVGTLLDRTSKGGIVGSTVENGEILGLIIGFANGLSLDVFAAKIEGTIVEVKIGMAVGYLSRVTVGKVEGGAKGSSEGEEDGGGGWSSNIG